MTRSRELPAPQAEGADHRQDLSFAVGRAAGGRQRVEECARHMAVQSGVYAQLRAAVARELAVAARSLRTWRLRLRDQIVSMVLNLARGDTFTAVFTAAVAFAIGALLRTG